MLGLFFRIGGIMLTKEELLDLEKPPKLENISLKLLQQFYESELTNKLYIYTLRQHKSTEIMQIKIRFFRENMPHLIGIQKVVPPNMKYRFQGALGFVGIKEGKITIEKLKSYDAQRKQNERVMPQIENRLTHLYLLPSLMEECNIVKFSSKTVKQGYCQIRSDFILYNEKVGVKIHLGVIRENDTEYYVPETFIVSSLRTRDRNRLTEGQIFMNVVGLHIDVVKENEHI